eukprot:4668338-Ditylum_brightwellii.AAC.2
MTSTAGNTALEEILIVLEYRDEEEIAVKREIGSLRRFKSIIRYTLKEAGGFTAGMIDEMMAVKEYYIFWSAEVGESLEKEIKFKSFAETFTEEHWDDFLLERLRAEREAEADVKVKQEIVQTILSTTDVSSKETGLNVSWKVETKEIPDLPANKTLKGKVFDKWHGNFYVTLKLAIC